VANIKRAKRRGLEFWQAAVAQGEGRRKPVAEVASELGVGPVVVWPGGRRGWIRRCCGQTGGGRRRWERK